MNVIILALVAFVVFLGTQNWRNDSGLSPNEIAEFRDQYGGDMSHVSAKDLERLGRKTNQAPTEDTKDASLVILPVTEVNLLAADQSSSELPPWFEEHGVKLPSKAN
jgi:hypothetical protein